MSSTPQDPAPEAMTAEFDDVALWTQRAVDRLGPDHALPAACRGSGSPAALDWLCRGLRLEPGTRLLDAGSGLGGPAAYAARTAGARPVLAEPMRGACVASRRLFAFPTLTAWSQALPLADASFPAAWCLGVLSTTTAKLALLQELRRVLRPQGRLGLLVVVQHAERLPETPEGNAFPRWAQLLDDLDRARLRPVADVAVDDLPGPPPDWQSRADAVEAALEEDHAGDPAYRRAQHQQEVMGRLLGAGQLAIHLLHAVAV